MKPHLNIGAIGHVDHGKTTLTAAIVSAMATVSRSDAQMVVCPPLPDTDRLVVEHMVERYTPPMPPVIIEYRQPRTEWKPRPNKIATLLGMTMMLAGSCGLPGGGPSAAAIRHDPKRPKTPADLERMAAAQRKRDRKAARRNAQNVHQHP